jgi:hypothetical protein
VNSTFYCADMVFSDISGLVNFLEDVGGNCVSVPHLPDLRLLVLLHPPPFHVEACRCLNIEYWVWVLAQPPPPRARSIG